MIVKSVKGNARVEPGSFARCVDSDTRRTIPLGYNNSFFNSVPKVEFAKMKLFVLYSLYTNYLCSLIN